MFGNLRKNTLLQILLHFCCCLSRFTVQYSTVQYSTVQYSTVHWKVSILFTLGQAKKWLSNSYLKYSNATEFLNIVFHQVLLDVFIFFICLLLFFKNRIFFKWSNIDFIGWKDEKLRNHVFLLNMSTAPVYMSRLICFSLNYISSHPNNRYQCTAWNLTVISVVKKNY